MPALLSSLLSILTHSTEMLGCSWALLWSETTLSERKLSYCFSNLLKSHSQNAAWTRLKQFWLPLLYTNMQNYPSRLWSLKCHTPFCFMLLIPVDSKNTPVLRWLQTFELTTKQNIENKSYGHGHPTWGSFLGVTFFILETLMLSVDTYRHWVCCGAENSRLPWALLQCQESIKVDKKQSSF